MDLIANGLNFPTSVAFDTDGTLYIAESGLTFGGAKPGGRVLRLEPDGRCTCLLDGLRSPVNGLTFHDNALIISEGGHPGRISRLSLAGEWRTLVDGLPGFGNYHTNMVAVGPDGRFYFSQGAMTNSGIVGLDAYELGWLRRLPHNHDVPGIDIFLAGVNVETDNPIPDSGKSKAITGAFVPFDAATKPGQRVPGRLPCTAAVLRCNPDGSELTLVAWGLRNAYGLGFLPDGRLLAVDQGADDRGSRPLGGVPDLLFAVEPGKWYGWPDFIGQVPVTHPRFRPQRGRCPEFVLTRHSELPPLAQPLLEFPPNAAATKFDVIPSGSWEGHLLVALFGDEKPMTAPSGPRVGRCLARVDPADWTIHPLDIGSFNRPIDVRFHPHTGAPYVLDFGEFEMIAERKVAARAGSGKLWKLPGGKLPITRN